MEGGPGVEPTVESSRIRRSLSPQEVSEGSRCGSVQVEGTLYHGGQRAGLVSKVLGNDHPSVIMGAAAAAVPSSGALFVHVWARSLRRSRVLDRTTDKDTLVRMKLTISEYCRSHLTDRSDARRLSAALAALQGRPSTE